MIFNSDIEKAVKNYVLEELSESKHYSTLDDKIRASSRAYGAVDFVCMHLLPFDNLSLRSWWNDICDEFTKEG